MKIHQLKPAAGAHRRKTRKGRGEAAGKGKTAGRGTKGTGARGTVPAGFEGGQMPLQRRLPKIGGATSRNRVEVSTVNVGRLNEIFAAGTEVTPALLREHRLVRRGNAPVKILGHGDLSVALNISAQAFSSSAKAKIEAAGGSLKTIRAQSAVAKSADATSAQGK